MTEPLHSPYGPSGAKRWLNCPAVINATKGLPDTDSEFSTEGTAGHTLAQWCQEQDKPASHWLSKYIDVRQVDGTFKAVKITQSLVDGAQEFVDYCNSISGLHLTESRVYYEQFVPNGWGTLDHAVLQPGAATIIDLKMGMGIKVFAEHNEQLMCYALGVLLEWDWLFDFQQFVLTVHQPRIDHVDTWEISRNDLVRWAEDVLTPGYWKTLEPDAQFNPGSWCKFCKIDGRCRAQAKAKFETAMDDFEDLDKPGTLKKPATLTNDELAALRPKLADLVKFASACNARIIAELKQGNAVGGLKLVAGNGERAWDGDDETIAAALQASDVPPEKFLSEPELLSPPKLEKVLGKARFKAPGKKTPAGDLYSLVRKVPGAPVIADGDDPRPALTVDVLTEFSNLNEEQVNE